MASLLAFVPRNIRKVFCQLSSIDAEVYNPPEACNNIWPPSPNPPAVGGPNAKVFSVEPKELDPIVNEPVIIALPFTWSDALGDIVPIPTLPCTSNPLSGGVVVK